MIIYVLFSAFLIAAFGKWLVMALSTIVLRKYCHKLLRRKLQKEKARSVNGSLDNLLSNSKIRRSGIKYQFNRYLNGYLRFFIFRIGHIPSHHVRNFVYKRILLVDMSDNSVIYWGAEIRAPYLLKIGRGTIIGDKCLLDARNRIEIGSNVNFSSNVSLYSEQHDHRDRFFACNSDESFRIKIDDRAWIGPNVVILPGVHIGEGAVVGAGSIVTKDVPPFSIAAGMPAKVIAQRTQDLIYELDGQHLPFC